MKQLTIRIPDNKFSFLTELLKNFSFIKVIKTEDIPQDESVEHVEWSGVSLAGIASAYEENEPDYTNMQLKEPNNSYKNETG